MLCLCGSHGLHYRAHTYYMPAQDLFCCCCCFVIVSVDLGTFGGMRNEGKKWRALLNLALMTWMTRVACWWLRREVLAATTTRGHILLSGVKCGRVLSGGEKTPCDSRKWDQTNVYIQKLPCRCNVFMLYRRIFLFKSGTNQDFFCCIIMDFPSWKFFFFLNLFDLSLWFLKHCFYCNS